MSVEISELTRVRGSSATTDALEMNEEIGCNLCAGESESFVYELHSATALAVAEFIRNYREKSLIAGLNDLRTHSLELYEIRVAWFPAMATSLIP